jgi:hypothetical protein
VTSTAARTAANVILISAGAAAAYVIITTPPLRRVATRAVRLWLGGGFPLLVVSEISKAWTESAPRTAPITGLRSPVS